MTTAGALLTSLDSTISLARAALSSASALYDPDSYPSSLSPSSPLPLVDILAVKSSLLSNYMSDLSSFLLLRCGDGSSLATPSAVASLSSSRSAVLSRLHEQRVALQKLRPLEKRTQYATSKLADRGKRYKEEGVDGVEEGEEGALRARPEAFGEDDGEDSSKKDKKKKKKKGKGNKGGDSSEDDADADSAGEAGSDDELLALKQLVSGKVSNPSKSSSSSSASAASSSSAAYSAPRLSAVQYDGDKKSLADDRRRKKDLEKLSRSEVLQSLRREFGDRPDVAGTDGIGDGGKGGRGTAAEKLREMQEEKRQFEEERFMRFVESREEKKLKRKLEREQMSIGALTDFGSFANNVDDLERLGARDERRAKGREREDSADDSGKKRHSNGKRIRGADDINVDGDVKKHKKSKKSGMNELQALAFGGGGGGNKKKANNKKKSR